MIEKLERVRSMEDFKVYLNYPRIPEGEEGAGLFKMMKFNTCERNSEYMVSWFQKENELYLIRISKKCVNHIQESRFQFGGLPIACNDLKFIKNTNLEYTKEGNGLISIQILMPGELAGLNEYISFDSSPNEIHLELDDSSISNDIEFIINNSEEAWQNNPEIILNEEIG